MAGQPKTRARREAARRAAADRDNAIPDALPSRARAPARTHDARPREPDVERALEPERPGRPGRPPSLRSPILGASTRSAVDDAQASTMLRLAALLKPGVSIRIERSRPTWAAGWLEDHPLEATGDALSELYEHLRDEHGGQLYRLTVLSPGEQPLYVGSQAIAGPVRVNGRAIGREAYELSQRPANERVANAAPAPAEPFPIAQIVTALGSFVSLLISEQDKRSQMQLDTVRDMAKVGQRQSSELVSAVLQVRQDEREQRGLVGQVTDLIEGLDAVEAVRSRFGAARAPKQAENDTLNQVLGEATKAFFGNVMQGVAQKNRGAASPRPVRRQVVRRVSATPTVGDHVAGLPDAIAGQIPRTN